MIPAWKRNKTGLKIERNQFETRLKRHRQIPNQITNTEGPSVLRVFPIESPFVLKPTAYSISKGIFECRICNLFKYQIFEI